jgi:hypothetical protein
MGRARTSPYSEKSNDWFWAVGIITLTAAALAFIFGNIIFGIFIIVGVFSLVIHSVAKTSNDSC